MANDYYTAAGKTVANLDESDETDINDINTAVEAACDLIEADVDAVRGAREWAITVEDTLVPTSAGGNGVDEYSALHHAAKASASATASESAKTDAETAETNAKASEVAAAASVSVIDIDDTIQLTSVGTDSGDSVTGTKNTLVGYKSGEGLVGGVANTLIGYNAGKELANSTGNTICGSQAGETAITTLNCSLFGVNAGRYITTGVSNSLFGVNAGVGLTTGFANVAVGEQAGAGIIDLDQSIFIGFNAGKSHLDASGVAMYLGNGDDGGTFANTWLYGDASYNCHLKNGHLILTNTHTPSSAGDTGIAGQVAWDADFIYICTTTDTWKRVAIATW